MGIGEKTLLRLEAQLWHQPAITSTSVSLSLLIYGMGMIETRPTFKTAGEMLTEQALTHTSG